MAGGADDYHAYLFRMWRTGPDGPWRVSLEDVQTGERIGFGSLLEVYGYLQTRTGAVDGPQPNTADGEANGYIS
jgi:hypothetical protein